MSISDDDGPPTITTTILIPARHGGSSAAALVAEEKNPELYMEIAWQQRCYQVTKPKIAAVHIEAVAAFGNTYLVACLLACKNSYRYIHIHIAAIDVRNNADRREPFHFPSLIGPTILLPTILVCYYYGDLETIRNDSDQVNCSALLFAAAIVSTQSGKISENVWSFQFQLSGRIEITNYIAKYLF